MISITWTNAPKKAAGMANLGARVKSVHIPKWAEQVGQDGEESIWDTIFKGGQNPTIKGGPRILSGQMLESVEATTTHQGAIATATAGYGAGTPEWTKWQEGGTRPRPGNRGIAPMESIPQAIIDMTVSAENRGDKMMINIRKEWNTI